MLQEVALEKAKRQNKTNQKKLIELKEATDKSTIIVGTFNSFFSIIDRKSRQKISKDIDDLDSTTKQLDQIDIYRTLHPMKAEYTFSPSAHGTCTNIDHILGLTIKLNKIKRIEIIQSTFSDHNKIKLKINNRYSENHQIFIN